MELDVLMEVATTNNLLATEGKRFGREIHLREDRSKDSVNKHALSSMKASCETSSLQVDTHAHIVRPQPHFTYGCGGLQRDSVGAESVWVQEQRAVLWRRHQPQRKHQRQRGAQGDNER